MALLILAAPYCLQLSFIQDAMAREPAPVIEAASESGPSSKEMEARLIRLERLLENQTLVELMTRIDQLQLELQSLLGQTEEQTYAMQQLKKRQRDLYLDIDQRLVKIEEVRAQAPLPSTRGFVYGGAPSRGNMLDGRMPDQNQPTAMMPGMSVPSMTATSPNTFSTDAANARMQQDMFARADTLQQRTDYERAFNLLKEGRYDLAVAAFKTFVQTYPKGQFADNAQYWLGEANYVQRHFKIALAEFAKVVDDYPTSAKRADAMLKMGYTYQELEQDDKARMSLNKVVITYPNTTAASLAKKRLQDLKQF